MPIRRSKYKNVITEVDGIKFHSKKEAARWSVLFLLEKAGKIRNLERQVAFKLEVNGVPICKYIADAVYLEDGEKVVEDVKSEITKKERTYVIKKKLMKAIFSIEIRET